MKKAVTLIALLAPLQVAATPQNDQAAIIERLSDTYAATATIAAPAAIGGSVIRITGCAMTIISTTQYQNSDIMMGFSTHIDLSEITFGSANTTRTSYMIKGEGAAFEDHGVIPFYSDVPYSVKTHGPLPDLLGPDATLAFTVVQESEVAQGGYVIAQTTPAEIARLTDALVAYQQDYCLPAS